MLKSKKIISVFFVLVLVSSNAFAKNWTTTLTKAKAVGHFPIGIGSEVTLNSSEEKFNGPSVFLGSSVLPSGDKSFQLYLNKKSKKLFYFPEDLFASVKPTQQTVLDSYQQTGGTCSAYAINNFLGQTNLSGFEGTGELKNLLSNEEGRTFLLADAINEYYLTLSHRYSLRGILNKYGKKFGFKCKMLDNDSYDKVRKNILEHLAEGLPVVVSFNIGPEMVKGPFKLDTFEQKGLDLDDRLWIPRRVGERNNGGHTIVAVGSFEFNNKTYLVMNDSDWSEPRVWDMDLYLNHEKTALDEIEFVTCK